MIKFAAATAQVYWRGETVTIGQDQPWHADDPFVRDRPDLFVDVPSNVQHTSGFEPGVEHLPPTGTRRRSGTRG